MLLAVAAAAGRCCRPEGAFAFLPARQTNKTSSGADDPRARDEHLPPPREGKVTSFALFLRPGRIRWPTREAFTSAAPSPAPPGALSAGS